MAETITDLLLDLCQQDVPEDAGQMMRLSLFDWAACGIAGARETAFDGFKAGLLALGEGRASVIGGGSAPSATAALMNGTLSHAIDYDDTHFAHIGHPSVAVLPAVLALAEQSRAGMGALIKAATIGVEGSILTGLWLGRDHYQVGYHQTATAGAFGAALACCHLLQMDKTRTRTALGLCASMASGLKAQFGTMAKPLNAGLAARTGVEAAQWALAGMTAAQDGLGGPLGFGPTHHGMNARVSLPQGSWRILEISHKFHACCHGLHAMLEGLGQADLDVDGLESLQIHTHPRWMTVCNIASPTTGLEAKFSYAQTAAMTLLGHDTGSIDSFSDGIAHDPALIALRARVRVVPDDTLTETQARIDVTMRDGQTRQITHDLMARMTFEVRAAKLRKKASALLSSARADALWQSTQGTQGDTLRALTDQLVMS